MSVCGVEHCDVITRISANCVWLSLTEPERRIESDKEALTWVNNHTRYNSRVGRWYHIFLLIPFIRSWIRMDDVVDWSQRVALWCNHPRAVGKEMNSKMTVGQYVVVLPTYIFDGVSNSTAPEIVNPSLKRLRRVGFWGDIFFWFCWRWKKQHSENFNGYNSIQLSTWSFTLLHP